MKLPLIPPSELHPLFEAWTTYALPAELAQTFDDLLMKHRWLAEQFDDWIDQEVAKLDTAWPEGEIKPWRSSAEDPDGPAGRGLRAALAQVFGPEPGRGRTAPPASP